MPKKKQKGVKVKGFIATIGKGEKSVLDHFKKDLKRK